MIAYLYPLHVCAGSIGRPIPPRLILGWNSQEIEDNNPPPTPVDPDRLTALLLGLPRLEHEKSIVASARLYALALELIREQPNVAYQLLVSSAETIANETISQDFQPDDEAKVEHQQRVFKLAQKFGLGRGDGAKAGTGKLARQNIGPPESSKNF